MKIILDHARSFLKQTESQFSTCLDSTAVRIRRGLNEFDYNAAREMSLDGDMLLLLL